MRLKRRSGIVSYRSSSSKRTCFDVSVPSEEFQSAFEAPHAALAAPHYPVHAGVVVILQTVLNEGNNRPDQADDAYYQCSESNGAHVIPYEIPEAFYHR